MKTDLQIIIEALRERSNLYGFSQIDVRFSEIADSIELLTEERMTKKIKEDVRDCEPFAIK